jgi:peptidoglycan/xylan/chitin deacetylase (PgdA/CDA1 family)
MRRCVRLRRRSIEARSTLVPVQAMARKRRGLLGGAGALMGRPLPVTGRGAVVLCYHDVGSERTSATDYVVSAARLRSQLEAIASWGLRFVQLEEVISGLEAGTPLDGLVAVTFDDALVGVLEHGLNVLLDLRVPATVFVVTDVRGVDPPFWPGAQRTLDPDELRALCVAGIRLGSHTRSHPSLTDIDDERLRDELVRSREELEELTAGPCDMLAYPFGHHDDRVRNAAIEAGYRAACAFNFGRVTSQADRYALPRFCMGPGHHRIRLAYQLARPSWAW